MPTPTETVSVPAGLVVRRIADDGTGLARYTLFHAATSYQLCGPAGDRCAVHIDQAVQIVAEFGVDWTGPVPHLARDFDGMTIHGRLRDALGLCFDPEPPTARARPCLGDKPGITPRTLEGAR